MNQLADEIYDASVLAFREWRKSNPTETVFAFALSTIDDAIYVSASLNSLESYKRKIEASGLNLASIDSLDFMWGPWEWENEYLSPDKFSRVDQTLQGMYGRMSENSFAEFKNSVSDSMVEALSRLKENGIINNLDSTEDIILFATIYDSFSSDKLHRRSATLLNSSEAADNLLAVIGG